MKSDRLVVKVYVHADIMCLKGCKKVSSDSCYLIVRWHGLQGIARMVSSGDGAVVGVVRETRAINDDVLFVKIFSGQVSRIALPSCPQLDRTSKVLHVVQESVDPHGGCCVCELRA